MNKIKKTAFVFIMILSIFVMPLSAQAADYGSYLNAAVDFMQDLFYQDMDDLESLKAALRGMFGGLDDYSGFFDNEETEALMQSLEGNFVGIGAALEKDASGCKIIKVYDESPAQKAGLYEGDVITSVNGVSTLNKDAEQVASEIRGEEGTQVRLTIRRPGENADREFTLTRALVKINSVFYRIEGNVAYIRIDSFNSTTAVNFNKAMDVVDASKITKIMLDLRSNPGGYVDQAVEVARRIVPAGTVTTLDFKSERLMDQSFNSYLKDHQYMIAVLVDGGTASAAEILASAIQDSETGFLVGANTYGKGIVQQMFSVLTPEAYNKYHEKYGVGYVSEIEWLSYYGILPEDDEILGTIKITTGHYLTRNGEIIQGIGLKPEIEVIEKSNPNGIDLTLIEKLPVPSKPIGLNAQGYEVYTAERILRAAGYFKEFPDRQLDAKAQDAIQKFQTERKLTVTGILDAKTCEALNKLLDELIVKSDQPYVKAKEALNWF